MTAEATFQTLRCFADVLGGVNVFYNYNFVLDYQCGISIVSMLCHANIDNLIINVSIIYIILRPFT